MEDLLLRMLDIVSVLFFRDVMGFLRCLKEGRVE